MVKEKKRNKNSFEKLVGSSYFSAKKISDSRGF